MSKQHRQSVTVQSWHLKRDWNNRLPVNSPQAHLITQSTHQTG